MSFTGVTFSGPTPWFDIRAFGARMDGVTDDTAAVQAALTAANNAGGGVVLVPYSTHPCVIASQLVLDNFQQVELRGVSSGQYINNNSAQPASLKFTGNPSGAMISCRSTFGVTLRNLLIQNANSSFSGLIIDCSHSSAAVDTEDFLLESCVVQGTSTSNSAAACVGLDKTIVSTIRRCSFLSAKVGVRGLASSGNYSNAIQIEDTIFGNSGTTFGTAHVQNPGAGWNIVGCTFEIAYTGSNSVIDGSNAGSSSCGQGSSVSGCWLGDAGTGWSGSIFKTIGSGWHISGNFISGVSTANVYSFASGDAGITIIGNYITSFGTAFVFATNNLSIQITGNTMVSVTTVRSGFAASGIVCSDTGGSYEVNGSAVNSGIALSLFGTSATTGGLDVYNGVRGVSSLEMLYCNPSNGQIVVANLHVQGISAGSFNGIDKFAIGSDGGVAVGAPTGGDQGAGSVNAASGYYANGTAGVSAGSFSTITAITSKFGLVTQLTGTSDGRLKKNVKDFNKGLAEIEQLQPKSYEWNKTGQDKTGFRDGDQFAGLIAQDVEKVFPEAIGLEDNQWLTINERVVYSALINAVKELSAENKSLQKRIARLEK